MHYAYVNISNIYLILNLQHVLADAWVVKSSELGRNEDTIHCRTHLGHLLQPGDIALG